MKQTAFITDWMVLDVYSTKLLIGRISAHQRQDDFKKEFQVTSRLVRFEPENSLAETENTIYTLGEPAHESPPTHS